MCSSSCKGCGVKHKPLADKKALRRREAWWKKAVLWVGMITLLGAYVYGKISNRPDYQSVFNEYFPASDIKQISHELFVIRQPDTLSAYFKISSNNGYGGPLEVGVAIKPDTTIGQVIVISEKETQSFFNKLVNYDFFEQFEGLPLQNKLQTGEDIDGVSSATVSSVAFTHAIREAAHQFAESKYGLTGLSPQPRLSFGFSEISILALLTWSIALYFKKNKKLLYALHLVALVLIGFYLNLSISITNFGSFLQGYFPNVYDYLVWYILVIGVLIGALVFGKNVYCYRICPFYSVQWLANRISGINLDLTTKMGTAAKYMAGVLLWGSLLVGFLEATPSAGSYEPFATLFSFDGEGVQWFILPAVFFSSFFIKEVFCRYYCPVGGFLKFIIVKVRKPIIKQVRLWQNPKVKQAIS